MTYFLGLDIGSTKCHALVADVRGSVLGLGQAGAGNYQSVGYPGMAEAVREVAGQALAMAGLSVKQLAGAGFGISGYDWPSQRGRMLATLDEALGLRAPLEIVNDAVLGLLAGAEQGWGVALVSGTSNNCRGRDRHGREGRVTGEGIRFGEYGGASELAMKALHAVTAAWSRRGPPTALTAALVAYAGASDVDDLLEGVALDRYHIGSAAAPLIFQVAQAGDAVAQAVIAWAGHELGDLAAGVIRQLGFEQECFEVVMLGSMFKGGPLLTEPLRATIQAVAPGARLKRLSAPPVVGAVLLGMEQAGCDPGHARVTLAETAARLLDGVGSLAAR